MKTNGKTKENQRKPLENQLKQWKTKENKSKPMKTKENQ